MENFFPKRKNTAERTSEPRTRKHHILDSDVHCGDFSKEPFTLFGVLVKGVVSCSDTSQLVSFDTWTVVQP